MISERTKLSLGFVVTLAAALVSLAAAAAVAQYRIGDGDKKTERLEAAEQNHDRRIQRLEDTVAPALERIEKRLERMEKRQERDGQ